MSKKDKTDSTEAYRIIKNLKKADIIKLSRLKCKHGHSYLVHPNCALKEEVLIDDGKKLYIKEKIGFFDIECMTFQFKADMGIMLSYCLKELDGNIISNSITPSEVRQLNDKRLLVDMCKDLRTFTRVIGYYSSRFDLPFVRTRALKHGLDFPIYQEIYHTDLYFVMRNKFKLKSNRLKNCCDFFDISSKDTPFHYQVWLKAMNGDKKALKDILMHNKEDVVSTELLWKKVNNFAMLTKTSI